MYMWDGAYCWFLIHLWISLVYFCYVRAFFDTLSKNLRQQQNNQAWLVRLTDWTSANNCDVSSAFVSEKIPQRHLVDCRTTCTSSTRPTAIWLVSHQLTRKWMIWRNVASVLRCSRTLEFCRVSTRSVSSVCWPTARTNNLETAWLVHCAGKSSLFQTTGYRGHRRTSSWRNYFMPESSQPERKRSIFHAIYAAWMRQALVKLSNLLQCIVSSVNRATVNSVVCITGGRKVAPVTPKWVSGKNRNRWSRFPRCLQPYANSTKAKR